jgi:hypothetical protein
MIDKDGNEWGERGDNIRAAVLYTNRAVMVYNTAGHQIPFYQKSLTCYRIDKKLAQEVADKAGKFILAQWRGWTHEITKLEFEYLLGLRTRKMDMEAL